MIKFTISNHVTMHSRTRPWPSAQPFVADPLLQDSTVKNIASYNICSNEFPIYEDLKMLNLRDQELLALTVLADVSGRVRSSPLETVL